MQDDYSRLNDAINAYFFDGKYEHRPIYLDLEGDAAESVAASLGIDEDDLGDVIGETVAGTLTFSEPNPYARQLNWLRAWNARGRRSPPPFTALLCAFSIAAERMSTDENFSSNNYYARLFELLGVTGTSVEQKLRNHAKSTRQFWRALNIWLSEQDYELGRPTARPVNSWPYASYGLSQALVRDADRERFGRLFEAMRLVPGDNISESEMMLFVHEWMAGTAGPTPWLRKLWNIPDLRERVVAAALEELETWEQSGESRSNGPGQTKLFWTLAFAGFPGRRAVLALSARSNCGQEALEVRSVSDEVVRAALDGAGEHLSLVSTADEGILSLAPASEIDICRLLLGSTVLVGKQSGIEFAFTAKPIVVMARTEDGTAFREVQRAGLFEELAVFCHETWLPRVEKHLRDCAKPGYNVIRHGELRGVPEGWLIIRDVELVRAVDQVPNGMQQLNPIGGQASISVVGGLRLSPGLWHAFAPPRVEATSVRQGAKLEIQREAMGETEKKLLSVDASGDFMETSLDEIDLASVSNIRAVVKAVVKKSPTELAELGLSFRSAGLPRPLGRRVLAHVPIDGRLPWLGASSYEELPAACLRGAVHTGLETDVKVPGSNIAISPEALPAGVLEFDQGPDWKEVPNAEKEAPGTCVVRGYHHLKYDEYKDGDDRYDAKRAVCLVCGWETMSRTREEALQNAKAMRENSVVPARKPRHGLGDKILGCADTSARELELEIFVDGLCYLGRGSWSHFQRLCAPLSEEAWYAQSLASDLEALGHLDLARDQFGRIKEWQVTPPALVSIGDGAAYLAGFQGRSFLEKLQGTLPRGCNYLPWRAPSGLLVHRWEGIDQLYEFLEAAGSMVDPHGRAVVLPSRPAQVLAMNLESLGAAVDRMPPVHVDRADALSRYDVDRGTWANAAGQERPGAYKVRVHGTRYVYRAPNGSTRITSHAAAKILAARDEGKRLHAYDPAKRTFTSVLGAEPPGLFSRALAMSAGRLPRADGSRLQLEGVDPAVGALVIERLYEQE